MRGGANRRAGAGNDVPPRIVGAHDEAKLLGGGDESRRGLRRESDGHERAPGAARKPRAPASSAASTNRSSDVASAWPKASPIPHASDPSRRACMPMGAMLPRIPAQAANSALGSRFRGDERTDKRSAIAERKCCNSLARNDVARTRFAAAAARSHEQPHSGFDGIGARQQRREERRSHRRRRRHVKHRVAVLRLRAEANVGRKISQGRVRRRRRWRRRTLAPSFAPASAAPARGADRRQARRHRKSRPAPIPASALAQDRNAISRRDAERGDIGREFRRRARAQAAHLDAAARGDFDDAVAVWRAAAHSPAKAESGIVPIGCSRTSKPSPVGIGADSPGHAPRRSGALLRAQSCRGSALSAAKPASTSLRRGCHNPRRRAVSSRSAIAAAASGFSRSRKSRTAGSAI